TDVQEAFACKCGFTEPDRVKFNSHLLHAGKQDGKGVHKSLGRINVGTGELVAAPWEERSPEERARAMLGSEKSDDSVGSEELTGDDKDNKRKSAGGDGKTKPHTQILGDATSIRVIPRVFQMDYTPVMRMAQDAAVNLWGWRPDMPFENFIDTCLYTFFQEKGIVLCGYVVDDKVLAELESVRKTDGGNNGS
ncbi:unnamed protein product, partial [marine sediment metagenome]